MRLPKVQPPRTAHGFGDIVLTDTAVPANVVTAREGFGETGVKEVKRSKTEALSLRLDPKTKFILEFTSRNTGQTITNIVERAVLEYGSKISIGNPWDEDGNSVLAKTWSSFWDPDESVRTLKLLLDVDYPTHSYEDRQIIFAKEHWPFFFKDNLRYRINRSFVTILWPKIDEYIDEWEENRSRNYWIATEMMAEALKAANLAPPVWPPRKSNEIDDEIPF